MRIKIPERGAESDLIPAASSRVHPLNARVITRFIYSSATIKEE